MIRDWFGWLRWRMLMPSQVIQAMSDAYDAQRIKGLDGQDAMREAVKVLIAHLDWRGRMGAARYLRKVCDG